MEKIKQGYMRVTGGRDTLAEVLTKTDTWTKTLMIRGQASEAPVKKG